MIFGIHAVNAVIKHNPERLIEIYVLKGRDDERLLPIINVARKFGASVQFMGRPALDAKSDGEQHQGVIAKVKQGRTYNENDLEDIVAKAEQPFLLILDGVTDPHNLGACLRNADAAGAQAVIVPKDKSAKITPTVRKVAVGAAETVPLVAVTNLARTIRQLQDLGVWVMGTAGEADHTIYQSKIRGPIALVMGAEGKGMRRLTRENCDELVSLPMAGHVDSLNVSVATGVCMFEIVRQRLG